VFSLELSASGGTALPTTALETVPTIEEVVLAKCDKPTSRDWHASSLPPTDPINQAALKKTSAWVDCQHRELYRLRVVAFLRKSKQIDEADQFAKRYIDGLPRATEQANQPNR
jgi:hypothetical protein